MDLDLEFEGEHCYELLSYRLGNLFLDNRHDLHICRVEIGGTNKEAIDRS